jgi:hypothetical protein
MKQIKMIEKKIFETISFQYFITIMHSLTSIILFESGGRVKEY